MKKVVKLTKDQIKILESHIMNVFDAEIGCRQACNFIREAKEKLWEIVHKDIEKDDQRITDLRWIDKEVIVEENYGTQEAESELK